MSIFLWLLLQMILGCCRIDLFDRMIIYQNSAGAEYRVQKAARLNPVCDTNIFVGFLMSLINNKKFYAIYYHLQSGEMHTINSSGKL